MAEANWVHQIMCLRESSPSMEYSLWTKAFLRPDLSASGASLDMVEGVNEERERGRSEVGAKGVKSKGVRGVKGVREDSRRS